MAHTERRSSWWRNQTKGYMCHVPWCTCSSRKLLNTAVVAPWLAHLCALPFVRSENFLACFDRHHFPLNCSPWFNVQYKEPRLQLVMNYFLYTSTWNSDMPVMWHPTPHLPLQINRQSTNISTVWWIKIDSTLVPNFGYENTAISPDKQWRYVGLSLC